MSKRIDTILEYLDDRPFMLALVICTVICVIALIVILVIVVLGNIFSWWVVPTLHLHGQCQNFYQAVTIKGSTSYSEVKVCP